MPVMLLLISPLSYSASDLPQSCVSTHFDEIVQIKSVIDGDTVILADNRHIRLIGINTPEINYRNKSRSEPGAEKAKVALIKLFHEQARFKLRYGKERLDKHGRTLAHIYLENGLNIQAVMLKRGLALPLRIPPNLSLSKCYAAAALLARNKQKGLWSLERYKTRHVSELTGSESGFYYISAMVKRISESRSAIWLNLENNIALRVHKQDLYYFNKNDLMSLTGKIIEANGWLYKRNKQLRMRIRHKLDIKILNE